MTILLTIAGTFSFGFFAGAMYSTHCIYGKLQNTNMRSYNLLKLHETGVIDL